MRKVVVIILIVLISSGLFAITCPDINIPVFPADNPWHWDISGVALHPNSSGMVNSVGSEKSIHPDFGTGIIGIPYCLAGDRTVTVTFQWPDECDKDPYPIPSDAPIEGGDSADPGSDRHVLAVDVKNFKLYELYNTFRGFTKAGSGAIFDLKSNNTRPQGWTSADGAGLPVFPGLVKYYEVAKNSIDHPFRFTVKNSSGNGWVYPATHRCSKKMDPNFPKMGQRARLKNNFDVTVLGKQAQVIAAAMKKYGIINADNGGDWFISGAPDDRWNDEDVNTLKRIHGSDMEFIAEIKTAPSGAGPGGGGVGGGGGGMLSGVKAYGGPFVPGKKFVLFRGLPNWEVMLKIFKVEKKAEEGEAIKMPEGKPYRKIVSGAGLLIWNLKDEAGKAAEPGDYYIFLTDRKKNEAVIIVTVEEKK